MLLFTCRAVAQEIPAQSNTILVKGVSFDQACNALLDKGYLIDKKDNDLQTAKTEAKNYQKIWRVAYVINLRAKDSVIYISGTLTSPPETGAMYKDDVITYYKNKKNVMGYGFSILQDFALSFGKPVEYIKR